MTFDDDQRLELLERGLCEVATILAGMAPDRATFARLERITARYELPEHATPAPWEQPSSGDPGAPGDADLPPRGPLDGPARPA